MNVYDWILGKDVWIIAGPQWASWKVYQEKYTIVSSMGKWNMSLIKGSLYGLKLTDNIYTS